jgi:hypothetical protein
MTDKPKDETSNTKDTSVEKTATNPVVSQNQSRFINPPFKSNQNFRGSFNIQPRKGIGNRGK